MARRVALGLTLLALASGASQAVLPAEVRAGSYHVYSCALPNGRPAPTDGWNGSITRPFMNPINSCAEGRPLPAGHHREPRPARQRNCVMDVLDAAVCEYRGGDPLA